VQAVLHLGPGHGDADAIQVSDDRQQRQHAEDAVLIFHGLHRLTTASSRHALRGKRFVSVRRITGRTRATAPVSLTIAGRHHARAEPTAEAAKR